MKKFLEVQCVVDDAQTAYRILLDLDSIVGIAENPDGGCRISINDTFLAVLDTYSDLLMRLYYIKSIEII